MKAYREECLENRLQKKKGNYFEFPYKIGVSDTLRDERCDTLGEHDSRGADMLKDADCYDRLVPP